MVESQVTKQSLSAHVQGHLRGISDCQQGEVCFKALDPNEYAGLVQVVNEETQRLLEGQLDEYGGPGVCIMTVGSDGKKERHSQSHIELAVVYSVDQLSFDPYKDFSNALKDTDHGYSSDVLEVRDLNEQGQFLSHAFGNTEAVYPDRLLNSSLIAGDERLWVAVRRQVMEEMSADSPASSRVRRHMRRQVQLYRQALQRGLYAGNTIFDAEKGEMYYDEDPNDYRAGIKMSHLRSVQRHLDRLTAKAIRLQRLPIDQGALELPTSTEERIRYLASLGVIDNIDDIEAVIFAYQWSLQWYHLSQQRFKESRSSAVVHFDADIFREVCEVINQFTTLSV